MAIIYALICKPARHKYTVLKWTFLNVELCTSKTHYPSAPIGSNRTPLFSSMHLKQRSI